MIEYLIRPLCGVNEGLEVKKTNLQCLLNLRKQNEFGIVLKEARHYNYVISTEKKTLNHLDKKKF